MPTTSRCPPEFIGASSFASFPEQRAQTSDRRVGALVCLLGALTLRLGALAFRLRCVSALACLLSALACFLGALACRLLFRRHQAAIGAVEPEPILLSFLQDFLHDTAPDTHGRSELLAPEPPVLIGLNGLVEPARQAKPFQLARLRLVEEVLRRAEDPGVEIALFGAVLLRGGGGEHLEDDVRQASVLFPGDPDLAFAVRVDASHPEDVRSAESALRKVVGDLDRDIAR